MVLLSADSLAPIISGNLAVQLAMTELTFVAACTK
jgi:hypothetical protein